MGRSLRAEICDPYETSVVHVCQRCVRRAFLAGVDRESGVDYSFRREWIRRRMEALASVYGIDVLTYAIMSNHMHLILRNRPDVVATWSDQEVAIRWLRVFPGRRLEEHLAEPTENDVNQLVNQPERIAEIRRRLSDVSWFMRSLSEPIARMANRQDDCTGRFWEGRFKMIRIVDEAGLLACSMYVDLNPVRAAMAESPDRAVHTSAYDRNLGEQGREIDSAAFDLVPVETAEAGREVASTPVAQLKQERKAERKCPTGRRVRQDGWLAPLTLAADGSSLDPEVHRSGFRASDKGFLDLAWKDYWWLLRWTAEQGLETAVSKVPVRVASILAARRIDASMWRDLVWNFKQYFGRSSCAGSPSSMSADAERRGKRWHRGQRSGQACFAAG